MKKTYAATIEINNPQVVLVRTQASARASALTAGILFLAGCLPAYADYACSGPVNQVGLGYDGSMNVDVGFGIWTACNLRTSFPLGASMTIDSTVCKGWYAQVLAAQHSGASVALYMFSSTVNGMNPPACSSLGGWTTPGIYLIYGFPN